MEILPNDINVTIVSIIKSTFYCHFLPSPDNLRTARRMALDRGLQLWRLWSEISHQFFNHCLESIVLKSLINATRLEAVEELWSLIVGYERHDHLLVSSFVIIVSSLCHHCIIIVSSYLRLPTPDSSTHWKRSITFHLCFPPADSTTRQLVMT